MGGQRSGSLVDTSVPTTMHKAALAYGDILKAVPYTATALFVTAIKQQLPPEGWFLQ